MYTVELSPEMTRQMAYEIALPMLDEKLQYRSVVQHFEPRIAAARGMIAMGGGDLRGFAHDGVRPAVFRHRKLDGLRHGNITSDELAKARVRWESTA